jgi:pyruvate dehydrogenase E1 component beta subunit
MPTEILMPALSPTMTEGNLAKWVKHEGDAVRAGDVIAEIETDKATMEVEAVDEGTLGRILVPEGAEGVKVNTPIAVLLGDGEDAAALDAAAAAPQAPPPERVRSRRPPRPRRRRRRHRLPRRPRCRPAPRWSR